MKNIMNFSEFNEKKNWIANAVENKGDLHKSMHVAADKKIPVSKINKAISKLHKKKDHTAAETKKLRELNLAKTLKKINK